MARAPRFYGWRIVAVAFWVDFIAVGFFFYSYGVFLKAIAAELGDGTRTGVSLGIPIANLAGAVLAPFLGRALDRRPIKPIMLAGAVLVASGFALLALIESLWQLYLLLASFISVGLGMMGGIASSKLVANWFEAKRGRALGVATVGISLSGLVMPLAATWLVAEIGWRGAFLVYGAATLAVVVPVVSRFVVDRPEDLGLRPDGAPPPDASLPAPAPDERVWSTREILRSPAFWAIALCFALCFSTLSAILTHLVPHADDLGLSPYRAAALLSVAAGAGVLGKLLFGRLFDTLGPRPAVWSSFGTQIAGLLLLMAGDSFGALCAGALVFGFGMGGVVPLQGAVTGAVFGRLSFGKVVGLLRPVQLPIHALGIPLAGWIYDTSGSYDGAFRIFLGAYLAACLIAARLGGAATELRRSEASRAAPR